MSESVIMFTEQSRNPDDYSSFHSNLRTPFTQYATLLIDSLTTVACFEVLNTEDFLTFTHMVEDTLTTETITFEESFSDLNAESFATLLNELTKTKGITCAVDYTNRIRFTSEEPFTLTYASYNVRLLLGIYDVSFPINSVGGVIQCPAVGHYLSTPILYLIGTIGGKVYVNDKNGYKNRRVLMRINNSFSANFPVIANNADFRCYCLSNDLSSIDFELRDAHFRKVKLLSPLFICGQITGDTAAETIYTGMMLPPELMQQQQSQEG